MSLREPTELNQLGFGRLESEAELSQPKAQRLLNTDGVRSILETDHKVIDIADQGASPRNRLFTTRSNPRPLMPLPSLNQANIDIKQIKASPDSLVDDVVNSLWLMIEGRYGRNNNRAILCDRQHAT